MQDGEQQVLFIYFSCALDTCLQHGKFQNITGFLVQHEVTGVDRHTDLILPHTLLQFSLDRLQIQVQTVKQVDHWSVVAPQHTQQQVLWSDRATGQSSGFFT